MTKMIIDTETCNGLKTPLIYDIGVTVLDRHGSIKYEYRAIVDEVYNGMPELMASAHYARKLPAYNAAIANGSLQVLPLARIRKDLYNIVKTYDVRDVWAFNAYFDRKALRNTVLTVSNKLQSRMLPYDLVWRDIWSLACNTVLQSRNFYRYVIENNAYTLKGWPRTDAEITYRYLSGNNDFIESHTALDDARIESWILTKLLKRKTEIQHNSEIKPFPNGKVRQGLNTYLKR